MNKSMIVGLALPPAIVHRWLRYGVFSLAVWESQLTSGLNRLRLNFCCLLSPGERYNDGAVGGALHVPSSSSVSCSSHCRLRQLYVIAGVASPDATERRLRTYIEWSRPASNSAVFRFRERSFQCP